MSENVNSHKSKVCLVTGANKGIGKAVATGLAAKCGKVYLVCRDKSRGETAVDEIIDRTGNHDVYLLIADLSSQKSIRKLAVEIKQREKSIDILINNAGIIPRNYTLSVDNIELQFAVNHLAYFLLTNLLTDELINEVPARIVNIASVDHGSSNGDFININCGDSYNSNSRYALSKLANVLFTYELADRLSCTKVTVNCLDPGIIGTALLNNYFGYFGESRAETHRMYSTTEQGAETPLYLALSHEVENISGKYFINCRETSSSSISYAEGLRKELWMLSADLTGLTETTV